MIRALARLLPYFARVRRSLVVGLVCILAATAFSLAAPWVLKYAIDDLVAPGGIDRARLMRYAAALVGLAAAEGWFRYRMRMLLIGASREIEYDLRNDFLARLVRLPQAYFQASRTGDLMSRATNDLSAVRLMLGPAVMYFVSTALGFVIAVGVMASIDGRLTLLALLPLPGVTLATRYFGQAIHDRFERIQAQLSDMSAVVQEALAGVRVVRAYRQERNELARFQRANDEYVVRNQGLIRLQSAFYPSLTLCFGLSGAAVLWFGGRDVMTGRLTLGEFVAFGRYLVLLAWPLIAFGWVVNIVQRGAASWERMLEVLDAPASGDVPAPVGRPVEGRIEARHLTFRYPGTDTDALADVSFVVEPATTVAIVGATGSGKSTIIQLLARLHDPPRGMLFVDGIDVLDWPVAELRRAIGLVAQEPFLFSTSIEQNIAFGLGELDDDLRERVRVAATMASLDRDVTGFPSGYETVIGERGITLSGGQKQRLALARAIVVDPRILVLDDSFSAVDTATEDAILRQLAGFGQRRTTVLVAHRVSTVRRADLILVLAQGRVVERGRHDDLVASGGVYADMDRRQQLEDELTHV